MSNKKHRTHTAKPAAHPSKLSIQDTTFASSDCNLSFSVSESTNINYSLTDLPFATPLVTEKQETAPPLANISNAPVITSDIGPDPGTGSTKVSFETIPVLDAVEGIRFDFAFGYRIWVPKAEHPLTYQVKIYDMNSGILLADHTMTSGQSIVGEPKYFIPYHLEIFRDENLMFQYDYDCTGKLVHIVIPDGGLGDNLAWLPIVERFRIERKANVVCVAGEWLAKLCGDLYPGLMFIPIARHPLLANSYANYFCGIFDAEHNGWRPVDHQVVGMQGAVQAILGLSMDQQPKCRLHTGSPRLIPEPYVCISTMGTNPCKCWNYADGWNQVIRFLKAAGYRVLDIDRETQLILQNTVYSTIPSEAENYTGRFPIQERINLMEHADFFVGLPSGLSWLAWNLNLPVVMLSGFTMPISEFPTPYRVTNYLACHGCWNDSHIFFDPKMPVWCPRHVGTPREIECTRAITPKMVIDTIMTIPAFQKQTADMLNKKLQEPSNGQA